MTKKQVNMQALTLQMVISFLEAFVNISDLPKEIKSISK